MDGLVSSAIFNDGGQFHALLGRCPHASRPMGRGWIEEGEVVLSRSALAVQPRLPAPLRRWGYRGNSLHRFRCEVRGHEVWVEGMRRICDPQLSHSGDCLNIPSHAVQGKGNP